MVAAMICGGAVFAAEIATDSIPQDLPEINPMNVDSGKVGHMVDFIMALQEKDDVKSARLLLNVLKQDPYSEMALLILLKKCAKPEILKTTVPELIELAEKNPHVLRLNLAVQLSAAKSVPPKKLADMGLATLKTVENPDKLAKQDQAIIAKMVDILNNLLIPQARLEEAEAMFEYLINFESLHQEILFLQSAALFYSESAKTGGLAENKRQAFKLRQNEILMLVDKYFKNPDSLVMTLQTAAIYRQLGAYSQAIALIQDQLLRMPDNQLLQETLGNLCFMAGRYQEALTVRRSLSERFPENLNYLNAYAESLLYSGDIDNAIATLTQLTQKNPKEQYFKFMLGMAYYYGGRYREAVEQLKNFKNFTAHRMLVSSYVYLKEYDQALAMMKEAEKSKRNDFILDLNFYYMYLTIGERSKRADIVRECAEVIREKFGWDLPEIANAVGYTFAELNIDLELAEKLIRDSLTKEPGKVETIDSMAWVLYRRGDFRKARKYIDKAIKKSGQELNPVIADHAGDIYFQLRMYERAVGYWKRAIRSHSPEIDPPEIKAKIDKAEQELAFED